VGPRCCLDWFRKSTACIRIQSTIWPDRSESQYPRHEAGRIKVRLHTTLPSALEEHQWITSSRQINSRKEPHYPFIKKHIHHTFGQSKWICIHYKHFNLGQHKINISYICIAICSFALYVHTCIVCMYMSVTALTSW